LTPTPTPSTPREAWPEAPGLRARLLAQLRLPASTYRLQLHAGFTFRDARAIVPYLARLGITDCYCSPYFRARPGSTHGYDICDYGELNPELGTDADFAAFVEELQAHGMGHILDFVPNHMAVEPAQNRWWRDLLEHGRASPSAVCFDIDWNPVKPELRGKVLLPFLEDHYGHVLERGDLQLACEHGALVLRYRDSVRPIDPRQYPRVLRTNLENLSAELGDADTALQELLSILTALDHLPGTNETKSERVAERLRESRLAQERLARLVDSSPRIARHIEEALQAVNGRPGSPESFDALHELLEAQPYRLAFWKTAFHEINFRRFFDINALAALRMEDPTVFAATHALALRLIGAGQVTGLRLDHLDGLFDPLDYLETLQKAILEERAAECLGWGDQRSDEQREQLRAWRDAERRREPGGIADRPCYVVAEKVLAGQETLPDDWPIHGTTGYAFLNDLNRLFVEARNARAMKRIYERFTGRSQSFADLAYECKRLIAGTALASELNMLGHELNRISEGDRRARDYTLYSLRQALREIVACFPVYRTYVSQRGAAEADAEVIDLAIRRARRRNPAMDAAVFEFVRESLLPDRQKLSEREYRSRLHFAMKFQQYTSPLQAKGIEDTAFYRHNLLVSMNEVGGDPQHFGGTVSQFHEANRRRLDRYPHTMLATATHDTKRGEDARARINVLSEMPDDWRRQVSRWARLNARNRSLVDGESAPVRNDEYLFYQAALGCWPAEPAATVQVAPVGVVQRLREFMLKAVKEAKLHTSWHSPNDAYDRAVQGFVEQTLAGPRAPRFLAEFLPFQQRVAQLGAINSLAQVVLKLASPGVPDFYQGTELWDLSLVDPDNRRPVDYALRQRLLHDLEPLLPADAGDDGPTQPSAIGHLLRQWQDGRIKQFITAAGLRLRRRLPQVFLEGDYIPLEVVGELAEHVVAFARRFEDTALLAVAPRFSSRLTDAQRPWPLGQECWRATCLCLPDDWRERSFRQIFTGEQVQAVETSGQSTLCLADSLATCPVALLLSESPARNGRPR
jgi:(1->4)-alpha-D-glucan 1-alpha-D-glucosylmutase